MMGQGIGGPPVAEEFKAAPDFDPEDVMIWLEDAVSTAIDTSCQLFWMLKSLFCVVL